MSSSPRVSPRSATARSAFSALALALLVIAAAAPQKSTASSLFGPHLDFRVGRAPYGMAAADFNGDSIPDLVTANYGPYDGNTVSILFGNGDGTFREHVELNVIDATPSVAGPLYPATGDLDGDGKMDLVVLNGYPSPPLSIFIGNGDGTFRPRHDKDWFLPSPERMTLADINRDGRLDFITARGYVDPYPDGPYHYKVIVCLGDGTGDFNDPREYDGDGSWAVAVGDVSGDGVPDLVTTNFWESWYRGAPGAFSVMTGVGDSLSAPTSYPCPLWPYDVAIGDMNGDGRPDVVTANMRSYTLSVFLAGADHTFGPHLDLPTPGEADNIELADLNADGRLDIVTTAYGGTKVSVFMSIGGGEFAPRIDFEVMVSPFDIVATDLNRDGRIDLAVTNTSSNTVSALVNTGCDPQHPGITGVFPNRGGSAGDVTVSIYGCGFQTGAAAKLTRGGETIDGNPVTVSAAGTVVAGFNLTGHSLGSYDVEVSNPGEIGPARRFNGFDIVPPIFPIYRVRVDGPSMHKCDRPYRERVVGVNEGNNNYKNWLTAYIENTTCIKEGMLRWIAYDPNDIGAIIGECDIVDFTSKASGVTPITSGFFTMPWNLPAGFTTEQFYTIGGHAEGRADCCIPVPQCDSTLSNITVTAFQAQSQGAGSPGSIIADQEAGKREGLLYRFWTTVVGGSWPAFPKPFQDALSTKVDAELKLVVDRFTNDPCHNKDLAFVDTVILEAVNNALNNLSGFGSEVTAYRLIFDPIYNSPRRPQLADIPDIPAGRSPDPTGPLDVLPLGYRKTFADNLKSLMQGLGKPPAIPGWAGKRDRHDDVCSCSCDPNAKYGTSGAGTGRYVQGVTPFSYTVSFENRPDATASAAEVSVTDHLDLTKVDPSTFSIGSITFGDHTVTPLPGLNPFQTDVDLRPEQNLKVRVTAQLNDVTGLLTFRFQSLDPVTGLDPEDELLGFLPPNTTPPAGEGSVSFTIMPRAGLPTDTEIRNQSSIVFDTNAPIETNEWLNTIDTSKPESRVDGIAPLAGDGSKYIVHWSGFDPGAGIGDYQIFLSDNDAPYTLWRVSEAQQDTFPGEIGHTYGFYSIARDLVGNEEDASFVADTTFTVSASATVAMGFDFSPGTLNLRSMGRRVTGHLEPPVPFAPTDIDTPSVRLNGVPADLTAPIEVGDHDGDGILDLMLKFDRRLVDLTVSAGDSVPMTVTGTVAGNSFSGVDYVRVIRAVITAPAAGSVLPAGGVTSVRWTTPSGIDVQSVALLSSLDDGATWNLDTQGLPNTGSADWIAPNIVTDQARLAVVLVESADETGYLVDGVLGTSGTFRIDHVTGAEAGAKVEFALRVVRPNPTTENLRVSFGLPEALPARIEVFNVSGRLVASREVGSLGVGFHSVTLTGRGTLPSGVYLVRLTQGAKRLTTRAVVVR